ncbi:MAG: hypothetical protein ACTHN2_10890 [Nitrobacter sp.]|jgi:hypothetical protein
MMLRLLTTIAAVAAFTSHASGTMPRAADRHVLHHCENVLAHAAKAARAAKKQRGGAAEVDRCRMVIREFVSRDSRMTVDQNGKMMR